MINPLSAFFKSANITTPPNWKGRTPPDTTVFAIGDVHGYVDALENIYAQIDQHRAQIKRKKPNQKFIEVNLADFTDRGPKTRETLDQAIKRYSSNKKQGVETMHVLADHEMLLQAMLRQTDDVTTWEQDFFNNGGVETLRSYGVTPRFSDTIRNSSAFQIRGTKGIDQFVHYEELKKMKEELWINLPKSHAKFLKMAEKMIHIGQYTFVHGGIDETLPVDMEHQDLLVVTGVRKKARDFATYDGPIKGDRIIVRAHTISPNPILNSAQIGVEQGIYTEGGKLTCVVLQDANVRFLQAETRLKPYNVSVSVQQATDLSKQAGDISAWARLE